MNALVTGYDRFDRRFPNFGLSIDRPLEDLLQPESCAEIRELCGRYGFVVAHTRAALSDIEHTAGWRELSNNPALYRSWHADVAVDHVLALCLPIDTEPRMASTGISGRRPAVEAILRHFSALDFSSVLDDASQVEWFEDTATRLRRLTELDALYARSTHDDHLVVDEAYNCLRVVVETIGYHEAIVDSIMPAFVRAVNEDLVGTGAAYVHRWRPGDIVIMSHDVLHARLPQGSAPERGRFFRNVGVFSADTNVARGAGLSMWPDAIADVTSADR